MQFDSTTKKLIVSKLEKLQSEAWAILRKDYDYPRHDDEAWVEIDNLYEKLIVTFDSFGMISAKEKVEKVFAECKDDLYFVIEEPPRYAGEYLIVREFYDLLGNLIFAYSSSEVSKKIEETVGLDKVLFPLEIVDKSRDYIKRVAVQANGCYQSGYYDACAVMVRRLIETLIIECFEKNHIDDDIKNENGDFVSLKNLVSKFLAKSWNVSRETKKSLKKLHEVKILGDRSAHNRRITAKKDDIDKISDEIRVIIEELVTIAFPE